MPILGLQYTHCPGCGKVWFGMMGKEGCLTKGCENNITAATVYYLPVPAKPIKSRKKAS